MFALNEYIIKEFDLNNLYLDDIHLNGINIINLPSIPTKSILPGEYLVNKIDFENLIEQFLEKKGKKVRQIDCQFLRQNIDDINSEQDILLFKNICQNSFSNFIKQIRRKFFFF